MNIYKNIMSGGAIAHAQNADRRNVIPYRPEYNLITGDVAASILLQQIWYWWDKSGRRPFYKYRAPCKAARYKKGESWIEELGFSGRQFDNALQSIAIKIVKGVSKKEALRKAFVIYWTDSNRVTWYQLNENIFFLFVGMAYENEEILSHYSCNYLGTPAFENYIKNIGAHDYLYSEITTETTTETTIPAQQNSNASDSLNLEPSPDGDISFPENTTIHKSHTKTDKATEGATDGLTTSQQDKSCLNDYFPREDPVETQPTGKHSAAEVRESSAAALRNYAQRNSAEPWREWFPGTVKDVNGVPAYELQKVGHTLCSVTGWQPDPRMVRAWLPELARLYDLAGGKVKYIQSATEEVWQREPQYRPKSPHGLAQPVMDYRARSKPPSPDEQRKLWNLGGR